MERRTFIKSVTATGAGLALVGTGSADDRYRPGGPWATSPDPADQNYAGYYTNAQLADRLERLDRRSDRIGLREIGRSAGRNDPIWEVTVGDGDERVHLINGIHGDEPSGLEATMQVLERLALGDSRDVEAILEHLSLTIIPDVNPDGNEFRGDDGLAEENRTSGFYQRRTNTIEWADGDSLERPYHFYDHWEPGGYDLNRDFAIIPDLRPDDDLAMDPDNWVESNGLWYFDVPIDEVPLEPTVDDPPAVIRGSGLNINPETRAVVDSFLEADPDWALTHHHQGAFIDPDSTDDPGPDWQTMMSVMAPQGPAYGDVSDDIDAPADGNVFMSEDAERRSLQLGVLAKDAMAAKGGGKLDKINRFPYGPLWGSYEEVLPLYTDAAALLYEICHQSEDRGQKADGAAVRVTRDVYLETFRRIADGAIHDVDETRYFDEMSVRGPSIDNPHTGRADSR